MTFRHRVFRMLRHLMAAVVLLIAAAVGGEVYLRRTGPVLIPVVAGRASEDMQALLEPSSVCHHVMRQDVSENSFPQRGHAGRAAEAFRTNSFGMRGEEPKVPKPSGTFRILFLGDDTVVGFGSKEERTLPGLLQRFLQAGSDQPVEVLNAGIPGYCPLLSRLWYEHALVRLQPDLVLLHFDMNDVADDMYYRRFLAVHFGTPTCEHPSLRAVSARSRQMAEVISQLTQSALISRAFSASRSYIFNSRPVATAGSGLTGPYAWVTDNPPDLRIQVRHALRPLQELQQVVQQNGGVFAVTTCPVRWQLLSSDSAPELSASCRIPGVTPFTSELPFAILEKYCHQKSIPFLNSTAVFHRCEVPEKLFSLCRPMLSETGAAIYAREIAVFVSETKRLAAKNPDWPRSVDL